LGRLEKQRRIAEAAEAVFHEKGYDGATVRLIAARAGVATGTIFQFAPDKRSLLLLIFGRTLELLAERAFATLDRRASLVDQFLHIFRKRYEFFHDDIDLARRVVGELAAFPRVEPKDPGSPFAQYLASRAATRAKIATIVADLQRAGRIDHAIDPQDITDMAVAILTTEIREWLTGPRPSVAVGLKRLRKMLALALSGVAREGNYGYERT
jgi:AcrR family transcriptional regulator